MPVAAASGPKCIGRRGPNPISFVLSAVGSSLRLALSMAALILGCAWRLSALPAAMRDPLVSASGLPTMW